MVSIFNTLTPPLDPVIVEKMLKYYSESKEEQFRRKYASAMNTYGKFLEFCAKAIYLFSGEKDDKRYRCKDYTTRIVNSKIVSESIRLLIPSAIDSAFAIRNKRDVSHPTIKMDTSPFDCIYVSATCDWILGELIVELGQANRDTAHELLKSLNSKRHPFIYEDTDGKLIVLAKHLPAGKEALIKLYISNDPLSATQLNKGSEHTINNLRTQLRNLEIDKKVSKLKDGRYELLPPGSIEAENIIESLIKEDSILE